MKNTEIKHRSNCPISFSLDVYGDKWSLLILRDIMFYNRTRFADFMPNEHVATNILADRLSRLESMSIITKSRDPKFKNRFVYSTTQKGEKLLPLLIDMTLWGLEYDPESLASQEFIERIRSEEVKVKRETHRAVKRGKFSIYRSVKMDIDPK